jgi:membrane protease subunit HflK
MRGEADGCKVMRRRGTRVTKPSTTAVLALALAAYGASGFYSVGSDESGVALRFGRTVTSHVLPGIHWNVPWPFGRVIVEQTATSFIMPIGFRYVTREDESPASDLWLTGDTNVVTARLTVQYSIGSLAKFALRHRAPRQLLRRVGERATGELLAGENVDGVLTGRRQVIGSQLHLRMQEILDRLETGVRVQSISVQELAPPISGGVRAAFQEVQNASSDRERMIQEAHAYAAQIAAETEGDVQQRTSTAGADRHARIEAAGASAARFAALAVEHDRAPWLTKQRIYLETIDRLLPNIKTYVVEPQDSGNVNLRILR